MESLRPRCVSPPRRVSPLRRSLFAQSSRRRAPPRQRRCRRELEPLPEIRAATAADRGRRSRARAAGHHQEEGRRDRRGSTGQRQADLDQGHAAPRQALFPDPGSRRRQRSSGATASTPDSRFRCGCSSSSELILLPEVTRSGAPSRAAMPDVGLHARYCRGTGSLARALCGRRARLASADRHGHREHELFRDDDEGPLRADALRAPARRRAAVLPQPDGASRARRRRMPGARSATARARSSACSTASRRAS